MNITIIGYPLPAPVVLDAMPDDHIHEDGWLLTASQARILLDAWRNAPAEDPDVVRTWEYAEIGLFVTALHLDSEIDLSIWESAIGSDGDDLYSTLTMPFDFDITAEPADDNTEER